MFMEELTMTDFFHRFLVSEGHCWAGEAEARKTPADRSSLFTILVVVPKLQLSTNATFIRTLEEALNGDWLMSREDWEVKGGMISPGAENYCSVSQLFRNQEILL